MADERDDAEFLWPPAYFARQAQEAGEMAAEQQRRLLQSFGGGDDGFDPFGPQMLGTATFKTRVQSGGRISIPDVEREALGIEEGDIVQTIVVPLSKRGDPNEQN